MDIEFYREYCLKKAGTSEDTPFDEDTLVFKVAGKMFALCSISSFDRTNLKCDPETAQELRSNYIAVKPGWHMNKKHWNTILFDQDMDDSEILEWVDHSYKLVKQSLPKKIRDSI
ncbi:MAG: MmcQ/YjbR family DNA-binding protein [Bacteroidia bacterium]